MAAEFRFALCCFALVAAMPPSLLSAAEVRPLPSAGDYVDGPFHIKSKVVATTDVRQLGCPDCNPVPRILATADFNGDGTAEFVLTLESFDLKYRPVNKPTQMVIVSADGTPFSGIDQLPSRVHPREAVIADFNHDGVDDLFAAAQGPDGKPFIGEQNVLLLSAADGKLIDASFSNLPNAEDMAHGAAAGDIDGDGDLDLMVITNAGGGKAKLPSYFLINDGTGKFTYSAGSDHLPPGAARKRDAFLTARFADINMDGKADLLMAGSAEEGQASIVLYGDGAGNFKDSKLKLPRTPFGSKAYTTDIDVTDIDGDGDPDLILLNCAIIGQKLYKGLYVQVLINDAGVFRDETSSRIWGQKWPDMADVLIPHNLTLADLNSDGALDFVIQSLNPIWKDKPGDVPAQIGLNDGHGNFVPVRSDWLERERGFRARELLPVKSKGQWLIAGYDLYGESTESDFRTFGQNFTIYEAPPPIATTAAFDGFACRFALLGLTKNVLTDTFANGDLKIVGGEARFSSVRWSKGLQPKGEDLSSWPLKLTDQNQFNGRFPLFYLNNGQDQPEFLVEIDASNSPVFSDKPEGKVDFLIDEKDAWTGRLSVYGCKRVD